MDWKRPEFSEDLWASILERMTVYRDGRAVFTFAGGIDVEVKIPKR